MKTEIMNIFEEKFRVNVTVQPSSLMDNTLKDRYLDEKAWLKDLGLSPYSFGSCLIYKNIPQSTLPSWEVLFLDGFINKGSLEEEGSGVNLLSKGKTGISLFSLYGDVYTSDQNVDDLSVNLKNQSYSFFELISSLFDLSNLNSESGEKKKKSFFELIFLLFNLSNLNSEFGENQKKSFTRQLLEFIYRDGIYIDGKKIFFEEKNAPYLIDYVKNIKNSPGDVEGLPLVDSISYLTDGKLSSWVDYLSELFFYDDCTELVFQAIDRIGIKNQLEGLLKSDPSNSTEKCKIEYKEYWIGDEFEDRGVDLIYKEKLAGKRFGWDNSVSIFEKVLSDNEVQFKVRKEVFPSMSVTDKFTSEIKDSEKYFPFDGYVNLSDIMFEGKQEAVSFLQERKEVVVTLDDHPIWCVKKS